jgi:arsenate reductase-like glutaredoxin family protein
LPKGGIDQVEEMVQETTPQKLAGKHLNGIISKVEGNIENLDNAQTKVYKEHAQKLADSYLYEELMQLGEKTA